MPSPPEKSTLELAEQELRRRLENTVEAADIPGGQLATLYVNLSKAEKPPEDEDTGPQKSVLELVRDADLPAERKRELIAAEVRRLRRMVEELEQEALNE